MKVGYIRVSTMEQNPARQEEIMKREGVEKVFEEKISGKNTDRPQFQAMLNYVREGDTLYVESFSRLSRSTHDLLSTVSTLNERGVSLVSDKEKVDTSTPQGRFVLTIFAALAEFERETILERQKEGIAVAKAQGKYKGRTPLPVTEEFRTVLRMWSEDTLPLKEAVRRSGMSEATFFRKAKQLGVSKPLRRREARA